MPKPKATPNKTVAFDDNGELRLMCHKDGYVMCRHPGAYPFIMDVKRWNSLTADVPMLALTILEPYCSAIVRGGKRAENRPWQVGQRFAGKRVLLHAGKGRSYLTPQCLEDVKVLWPDMPMEFPHMGCVIGVATLTGCFELDDYVARYGDDEWACGPYVWRLDDVESVDPFPLVGRQGLFTVPRSRIPRVVVGKEAVNGNVGAHSS